MVNEKMPRIEWFTPLVNTELVSFRRRESGMPTK